MYGRISNKLGYLFSEPISTGLHGGPRKWNGIPLHVVVDIDCTGQVERTKILPVNVHIK
jgi:hypothetical protein